MRLTPFVLTFPAWLGAVSPALAQSTPSPRPSNAVFGPAAERSLANQGLDLAATFVQAYDDNLLADSGQVAPDTVRAGGHYTTLQGSGAYKVRKRSFEFALTGGSAFRSYSRDGRISTLNYTAGAGAAARLARRTTVTINQGLTYSSSSLFGLFTRVAEPEPGDAPPLAPDYYLSDVRLRAYVTTAGLTHGLSRRVSIVAVADYGFTDFIRESSGRPDMSTYGGRLGLSRNIGRHSSLAARYRYRTGEFQGNAQSPASEHGVEIAVEHSRVLSATRQVHFGVSVGVSSMGTADVVAGSRGTFYRTIGEASFAYPFGRSWQAGATYRRGLQYVPDLTEPIVSGGWSGTVSGLLTRRMDLLVSAAYSNGESAVYSASSFDTYTGSVRSRIAVSQSIAAYGEYLYYVYDFGTSALLARGMPSRLERHGLRAGLTFWIPAFRR